MEKLKDIHIPGKIVNLVTVIADVESQVEKLIGMNTDIRNLLPEQINGFEKKLTQSLEKVYHKSISNFFIELRARITLLKEKSPEELFQLIFGKNPQKQVIVTGTLFSIHFYLDEPDYTQSGPPINSIGFHGVRSNGSVSVTKRCDITRIKDIDASSLAQGVIRSSRDKNTTLHEIQHARYRLFDTHGDTLIDVVHCGVNETMSHLIDGTELPYIKARLLGLDFFLKYQSRADMKELYTEHSYIFWKFYYDYRRIMGNIIDFAWEFVSKTKNHDLLMNPKQQAVDILSATPLLIWHMLMPGGRWRVRDFVMRTMVEVKKESEEVVVEHISFEKFPKPIKIIHPPRKKQGNIIIIPSYNEGWDIIDAIESVADQTASQKTRPYSIMIVINNNTHSSSEVNRSNEQTMDLIKSLWLGTYPEGISGSLRRKMEKIMASDLHISVVDLFSSGESIEENNVGYARDVGGYMATHYLEESEDFMIQIDADTRLDPTYIDFIREERGFYAGQSGNVRFRYTGDVKKARELDILLNDYRRMLRYIGELGISKTSDPEDEGAFSKRSLYSGCNIAVGKQRFLDVGGIDHISGAEDVCFAMKVNAFEPEAENNTYHMNGVFYNEKLTVYPKYRPSERTEKGHGHGHEVIKKLGFGESYGRFEVQSSTSYLAQRNLEMLIKGMIAMDIGEDDFIDRMKSSGLLIPAEKYNELYLYTQSLDEYQDIGTHHHLERLIENIIGENYPKIPLEDAVENSFLELQGTYPDTVPLLKDYEWDKKDLDTKISFMRDFIDSYNQLSKLIPLLDLIKEATGVLEGFPILSAIMCDDLQEIGNINVYIETRFFCFRVLAKILGKNEEFIIGKTIGKERHDFLAKILLKSSLNHDSMRSMLTLEHNNFGRYTGNILDIGLAKVLQVFSGRELPEGGLEGLGENLKKGLIDLTSKKEYTDSEIQELEGSLFLIFYLYTGVLRALKSDTF